MKELDPIIVAIENRPLFDQIIKAHKLIVPKIKEHAGKILPTSPGAAMLHASFMRFADDDSAVKTMFIEMHTLIGMGWHSLVKVIEHDSEEDYNKAREEQQKQSVRDFGNENFPVFKDYNSERIGKI